MSTPDRTAHREAILHAMESRLNRLPGMGEPSWVAVVAGESLLGLDQHGYVVITNDAMRVAQEALKRASDWLQGEYAKGTESPGAQVQIAVNDALAELSRIGRAGLSTTHGDGIDRQKGT